jgi:ATP/maltotriose-dependent transcriptional regulator MalT
MSTEDLSPVAEILGATAALFDLWMATPLPEAASDKRHEKKGILSAREAEVLQLVAQGFSNRKIADQLVVSENTAKFHVGSLLTKLDASTRAEAVSRAVALGLLS